MPHRRADVLAHAVTLLDTHGLSALTMRRLGAELGVQPSAIYHHFPSKQALLAAVADEIGATPWLRLPERNESHSARFTRHISRNAAGEDALYVCVTLEDGHMAWSSPVWLG